VHTTLAERASTICNDVTNGRRVNVEPTTELAISALPSLVCGAHSFDSVVRYLGLGRIFTAALALRSSVPAIDLKHKLAAGHAAPRLLV
jgi:hypothetical protein